jgi:leader peptidase (prepilin peptidase)/N-methyltransferase
MFIPDSMWITILIGGIVIYIDSLIKNGWQKNELISRIVGAFAVSVLFYLIDYLKPDSIGGGDIKLMFAAGFALGWVKVMFSLMIAGLAGTIFLVFTHTLKKENMKKQVPFGPHLAVGIFVAMLFGDLIINWYTGLFA